MKKKIIYFYLLLYSMASLGQPKGAEQIGSDPVVGKSFPDILLSNVDYFPKKKAYIHDFKGKWLVLDFWNMNCTTCIASFPYTNAIAKDLKDKVQIILVGDDPRKEEMKALYAKFRERMHLQMPCSFDNIIGRKFGFNTFPQVLIIDDKGILRGWDEHLSHDQLSDLISGKIKSINPVESISFDRKKPFLLMGNGGSDSDFVFRSIIAPWKRGQEQYDIGEIEDTELKIGVFNRLGMQLDQLYMLAYFGNTHPGGRNPSEYNGKVANYPILELSDSTYFKPRFYYKTEGMFTYSLAVSKSKLTKEKIMHIMQNDLENYFGFKTTIETRDYPYYALVATNDAKIQLKTKGGKIGIIGGQSVKFQNFKAQNIPIMALINSISLKQSDKFYLVDETGIDTNIDIYLDCVMTDLNDVKQALKKNGLDIVLKKKPMNVLVISDKFRGIEDQLK